MLLQPKVMLRFVGDIIINHIVQALISPSEISRKAPYLIYDILLGTGLGVG